MQFDYALRRKGVQKMIAVVMEGACANPRDWVGPVGGKLGGMLYVNLTADDHRFDEGIRHLASEIRTVSASERVAGGGSGDGTNASAAVSSGSASGSADLVAAAGEMESIHGTPQRLLAIPQRTGESSAQPGSQEERADDRKKSVKLHATTATDDGSSSSPAPNAGLHPADVALIRQKSSGTLARLLGSSETKTASGKGLREKVTGLTDDASLSRWWRLLRRRSKSTEPTDEVVCGLRAFLLKANLPSRYEQAVQWCVDNQVDSIAELKEENYGDAFLTHGVGAKGVKFQKLQKLLAEQPVSSGGV